MTTATGAQVAMSNIDAEEALELTVVMPCLNESATVGVCVKKALDAMEQYGIRGEVVIADNGSTDGSQEIAARCGARVVPIATRGYGSALRGGIAAAHGRYVLMGDADDSYDFSHLNVFVGKLREGYDLVMGNRFQGGIMPGAMPPLHRYLGNPVLTGVGRLFFKSPVGDFHCGLRAFRKDAIERLELRTLGMEFASEMVVKATRFRLRVTEVPTTLSPDGRDRAPHLRTWSDGWRHLRFLLLYSPRWLFLYPGIVMFVAGLWAAPLLLPGPECGAIGFDVDTLLFAAMLILIGFQSIVFAMFTKVFRDLGRIVAGGSSSRPAISICEPGDGSGRGGAADARRHWRLGARACVLAQPAFRDARSCPGFAHRYPGRGRIDFGVSDDSF